MRALALNKVEAVAAAAAVKHARDLGVTTHPLNPRLSTDCLLHSAELSGGNVRGRNARIEPLVDAAPQLCSIFGSLWIIGYTTTR